MSLEPRLALIRRWCQPYPTVADIGAHRGHLARALLRDGHTVIATELTPGSYAELTGSLAGSGAALLRGDGLEPLRDWTVDAVVIAGLGAHTIWRILRKWESMPSRPAYIVQPMQGGLWLHRAIAEAGWRIVAAQVVAQRSHFYPTWLLEPHHTGHWPLGRPCEFAGSPHYAAWLQAEYLRLRRRGADPWLLELGDELRRLGGQD